MDMQFWKMILKLVIALPFVIFIIYASLKFGGTKFQNMQSSKFIKIIERVPLSKDNSLLVVKIGDKFYVMSSASGKVEVIFKLNDEEISNLKSKCSINTDYKLKDSLLNIIKSKKEGKDE